MKLVKLIHSSLDFFYPLFKRFFDRTTYYYAVCGASNLVLSWFLFFIFYQFLFKKENWSLPLFNFTLSTDQDFRINTKAPPSHHPFSKIFEK